MSGVSLAVAPRSDPDQAAAKATQNRTNHQADQPVIGGVMGSLRVIELQLVAFIMVFSVSGLVPLFDLIFPALATAYFLALARFAFPSRGHSSSPSPSQGIFQGSRLFRLYVVAGTAVGLFLPLAYVLGGFARGDEHAVRWATPHLFLLSFQILTENIISGLSLFSPPVRALVPLLYTVRRIFVLLDWINDVWVHKTLPANAQLKDVSWYWFGRCLAVTNLAYFSINLFVFLIPKFLPRAFDKYFRERDDDEVHAKMAEDKRSSAMNRSQPADYKKDD